MLGATSVQRHSRTGGYWFRRREPDHLRLMIGQAEITRSLGTKSLPEAKRRSRSYANVTAELFEKASQAIARTVNEGAASHHMGVMMRPQD